MADAGDAATIGALVGAWSPHAGDVVLAGTSTVIGAVAPSGGPADRLPAVEGPVLVVCGSVHPADACPTRRRRTSRHSGRDDRRRRGRPPARSTGAAGAGDRDPRRRRRRADGGRCVREPSATGVDTLRRSVELGALIVIGGDTAAPLLGDARRCPSGARSGPGTAWATRRRVRRARDHPLRRFRQRACPRRADPGHAASREPPPIAITMGDASGVGPRSSCGLPPTARSRRTAMSSSTATRPSCTRRRLLGLDVPIRVVASPAEVLPGALDIVDLASARGRPTTAPACSTLLLARLHAPTCVAATDAALAGRCRRHRHDADEQGGDPALRSRRSSVTPNSSPSDAAPPR